MQALLHKLVKWKVGNIFIRNICLSRCSYETHYDVLKLPRNCTEKEIRDSFIKLSKEYHPDKNSKDPDRHNKFVKLNEAYSVLSRPASRRDYDLSLIPARHGVQQMHSHTYSRDPKRGFYDHTFYDSRDKSKDGENMQKPYYGIKGIKKVSNFWIVGLCLLFAAVGVSLQVYLIRESVTFSRKVLDERSMKNAKIYAEVRRKALEEGNEAVFDRMRENEEQYKELRRRKE